MSTVVLSVALALGRVTFALPAVAGMAVCILALATPGLAPGGLLFFLLLLTVLPVAAVLSVAGLAHISDLSRIPASWGACVSAAACLLLFQSEFAVDVIEFVLTTEASGGGILLSGAIQLFSRVAWVVAAIVFLFAALVLLIELPFIWLLRMSGVATPALLRAYRPLLLFATIAIAVDFIAQFMLHELAASAILTR